MKLNFTKIKNFKIVTGENLISLQNKMDSTNNDEQFTTLVKLALGLHLVETQPNVTEARNEYRRLMLPENESERLDICSTVDISDAVSRIYQK